MRNITQFQSFLKIFKTYPVFFSHIPSKSSSLLKKWPNVAKGKKVNEKTHRKIVFFISFTLLIAFADSTTFYSLQYTSSVPGPFSLSSHLVSCAQRIRLLLSCGNLLRILFHRFFPLQLFGTVQRNPFLSIIFLFC